MVALVALTVEEAEIVVRGSLPEPSYRPYSVLPYLSFDELQSVGHSSPEQQEILDDTPTEYQFREPELPPFSVIREFSRVARAEHWRRSAVEEALLANQDGDDLSIIALGTVEGGVRRRDEGARNVTIRVRYVLAEPFAFRELRDLLSPRERRLLLGMLRGGLRPLSPKLGSSVLNVLHQGFPEVGVAMDGMKQQLSSEVSSKRESVTTIPIQEAASSALHIFSQAWHRLRPESDPRPTDFALKLEARARILENDVITDDASIFPGWERTTNSRHGWWEFHSRGRRLLVKNINVSPYETKTGADLVYVRRHPDSVVLVQYKLMEELHDGQIVFRPDTRLDDQLRRMLTLEEVAGIEGDDSPDSYRLGLGFSFVKFIAPSAVRTGPVGQLAPGYYLPAEFARRTLLVPETGPRGGAVYYIGSGRSLSPDMFARLVRDSWVGSSGKVTAEFERVLELPRESTSLLLAIDDAGPSGID